LWELLWPCDRRNSGEARKDLAAQRERWQGKYPILTAWAEENIEETWTFYRLPLPHHKHSKNTNRLERFNEEIRGKPEFSR
jgi:putative transposase